MKQDVRIVLVGDHGTGKTSLITTLVSEAFQERVPNIIPEVTIPPAVTPEAVFVHIVDTTPSKLRESDILTADVIVVAYSIDEPETFNSIKTKWMPTIRQIRSGKPSIPVILVGNKIDLRGSDTSSKTLEDDVMPIMTEFREIETCVETSAKRLLNVQEVFYFAQKSVLYPTAPLYDITTKQLEDRCVVALRRIFHLCDKDKDGALNDFELNEFQRKCFNGPLEAGEIEGVKAVVKVHNENGVNEVGLTESGFFFLHYLFIQRGRLETTWTVLRKFGYTDDLEIREDFLLPPEYLALASHEHTLVELSNLGREFLAELFRRFDKDEDGALTRPELEQLFETSPGLPWTPDFLNSTQVDSKGNLTLSGFLALWSLTTRQDYTTTLKYLAYLGFEGNPTDTSPLNFIRVKKNKAPKKNRNFFHSYIIGPAGSGRTQFLRNLVGATNPSRRISSTVVNAVELDGETYFLAATEVTEPELTTMLTGKNTYLIDTLVFVFDSSDLDSISTLKKLHKLVYELKIDFPCVFLANKADRNSTVSLKKLASELHISDIRPVSLSSPDTDAYKTVVKAALNPGPHRLHSANASWSATSLAMAVALGAVVAGGAYYVYTHKEVVEQLRSSILSLTRK